MLHLPCMACYGDLLNFIKNTSDSLQASITKMDLILRQEDQVEPATRARSMVTETTVQIIMETSGSIFGRKKPPFSGATKRRLSIAMVFNAP